MKNSTYTLRRLLALVLVLVMVGSVFAGCSKQEPDPTDPPAPSETTQQTDAPTDAPTDPTEEPTEAPTDPVVTEPPVIMGTVNADNLNVRNEPYTTGTDILKRLPINTRIEILEQKIVDGINWGRITEGWINLNYVTIDGEGTTGTGNVIDNNNNIGTGNVTIYDNTNGTITATELNIRKEADADSSSLGVYKKGDKVTILERNGDWGRTNKGWIKLKYVDLTGTGSGSTSSGSSSSSSNSGLNSATISDGNTVALGKGTVKNTTSLSIRSGPGTNYAQVSYLLQGETHEYFQKSGNWIRLKKGWVNSKYMELEYTLASGTVGTITATELHVRENADGEAKSLTTIKKDAQVTILETKGTWGKIEYETGKFGWISLDYFKVGSSSSSTSTYTTGEYTITAEALNYRKEANADSTSLGTYKKNDKVTVTEVAGNWGKTDKGWINLKYAKKGTTYSIGTGVVDVKSSLTVRDKASTSGKELGSLKKGDKVTITEISGDWGKIDYKSQVGWVNMKYIKMDPAPKYDITIGTITGGTVKASSTSYAKGDIVSLTVTPETGKELATLTYTPEGGSAIAITGNKFTMPASKVTINATFRAETVKYTVALNAGTGGKVTANVTSCAAGTEVALTVTPDANYVLKTLTAMNTTNNTTVSVSSSNKFTMPAGNVNIVATFEATTNPTYTVTTLSDKIAVSSKSAQAGDVITVTVTPANGYVLENVIVKNASDNSSVAVTGSGNEYTFNMPAAKVTVTATFKAETHTVTITQAPEGTVSTDKVAYAAGEKVMLIVNPAEGYEVDTLKANGTDVKAASSFVMPGSNVSVTVTFKKSIYNVKLATVTNGTVTGTHIARMGETVTMNIVPSTGYVLDKMEVKDASNQTILVTDNKFMMPASDVTVTVTFKAAP